MTIIRRAALAGAILMVSLKIGKGDWNRMVAREAQIQTRNRYYESNPILNDEGVAMISRPALKRFLYVGSGPIRAVYSQPGDFEEALFVVSGSEFYRVDLDGTVTYLQGDIALGGTPRMAATASIGDGVDATPAYLFMADGRSLYCYIENGYALGTLTGSPNNGDVVQLSTVYYKFTTGSVDAGTPAGTMANPWLVAKGATDAASFINFGNAVSATGNPGTDYSTALAANPDAQYVSSEANTCYVRANNPGTVGNDIPTTVPTGTDISWGATTLVNGGNPSVFGVTVPGDVGAVDVCFVSSYIVVIPVQTLNYKGRFYWIEPGETVINALDFATAETVPDPVFNVVAFNDQFWLPGSNSTEVWYFTGNINAPVQRLQGVTFARGTWAGTALQIKESMIIVDSDGGVFQISGGLARISNPSIEERIRNAILKQSYLTP